MVRPSRCSSNAVSALALNPPTSPSAKIFVAFQIFALRELLGIQRRLDVSDSIDWVDPVVGLRGRLRTSRASPLSKMLAPQIGPPCVGKEGEVCVVTIDQPITNESFS